MDALTTFLARWQSFLIENEIVLIGFDIIREGAPIDNVKTHEV